MIRPAIWIADPKFDNFKAVKNIDERDEDKQPSLSETQLDLLWHTHLDPARMSSFGSIPESRLKQTQTPCTWENLIVSKTLGMSIWVYQALEEPIERLLDGFELALAPRTETTNCQEYFGTSRDAQYFWDMPGWLFMSWVAAQSFTSSVVEGKRVWTSHNCRIVKDKDGVCHFLPRSVSEQYAL